MPKRKKYNHHINTKNNNSNNSSNSSNDKASAPLADSLRVEPSPNDLFDILGGPQLLGFTGGLGS